MGGTNFHVHWAKKKEIGKEEAKTWKILHEYRWKNTLFMGTGNKMHVFFCLFIHIYTKCIKNYK